MKDREANIDDHAFFWLPSDPERRLAGTLKYAPGEGFEGATLGGSLVSLSVSGPPTTTIVHGTTAHGVQATLFDALCDRFRWAEKGYTSGVFSATRGVSGGHYASESELVVRRVRVRFPYLSEWVRSTGIQATTGPLVGQIDVSATPLPGFRLGSGKASN